MGTEVEEKVLQKSGHTTAIVKRHPWRFAIGIFGACVVAAVVWSNTSGTTQIHTGSANSNPSTGSSAVSMQKSSMSSEHTASSAASTSSSSGASTSTTSASAADGQQTAASGNSIASAREVIEQASISLSLKNVKTIADKLSAQATTAGGFVESTAWSDNTQNSSVQITVRIPESQFTAFINHVKGLGKVTDFSQSGQDVTNQSNGLQQSIAELNAQAEAYTRLYNKAQSMKDMLQIQQSLTNVNNQIANLRNQLHTLNRQVQLATIRVHLQASAPEVVAQPASPSVSHALSQSIQALIRSFHGFIIFLAWIAPWAGIALIGLGTWQFIIRHKRAK